MNSKYRYIALVVLVVLLFKPSAAIYAQTIFFQDNFESGTFDSAKWTQNPTNVPNPNSSIVLESSNYGGGTGSRSAQQLYPARTVDGGGVGWINIANAHGILPNHFLIEYDFKLSSNFHFPLGQKMWRSMPNFGSGQGVDDTMINMQMNGYGTILSFEVFSNSSVFGFREFTIFAPISVPSVNTWHRLGYRAKKNTFNGSTPNADGQIEIFLDGVSVGSRSDVRLTAHSNIWFRDYWGGPGNYTSFIDNNPIPSDQWIRVDNFKIIDLTNSTSPSADTTPPTVAVTAPAGGVTVSGTVNVAATASDNVGVVGVQFKLDGQNLGAEDTSAPYSVSWNTTLMSNGVHVLTATGRDAAGNTTTSASISVTVNNLTSSTTVNLTSECSNPQPGWIWCDDFETNRLGSYFEYDNRGGDFVPVTTLGVNGSTGMRVVYRPGQPSAGGMKLAFGSTPDPYFRAVDAGTAKYRDIYWRLYVKNQAGWTGGGADKLSRAIVFANSTWAEAAVGHVWSGTAPGPDQDYLIVDPASGTDVSGNLRTTGYNDNGNLRWLGAQKGISPLFNSSNVGQWHCVETHMKLNTANQADGVFEFWVDGNLNAQRTGLNWLGSYSAFGINAIFFENYWNASSPVVEQRYIDNIVVSTQPIGCGSVTTAVLPASPTGLDVR